MAYLSYPARLPLLDRALDVLAYNLHRFDLERVKALPKDLRDRLFAYMQRRGLVRDDNVGIFVESETLLDLTECVALTDACAAAIASKNLVAIRLSHCSRLTDTALEVLCRNCRRITTATLNGMHNIGRRGLEALGQLRYLAEVDLSESWGVTDDALRAFMDYATTLRILTLRECYRVRWHFLLKQCAEHRLLNSLCLSRVPIDDTSIRDITISFPALRILDISWCTQVTGNGLRLIAERLPNLFCMNLWGIPAMDDRAMRLFAEKLQHLRTLILADCSISDDSLLSIIAALPTLTKFNVWGCNRLSSAAMQMTTKYLKSLVSLEVNFCPQLTDDAVCLLSGLKHLSNASFWGCSHLTGAGLEGVATTTLTSLNLASLDLLTDEAFTSIISRTPNLAYMNVNGCTRLTEAALLRIADCTTSLRSLAANATAVNDFVISALVAREESANLIESLSLDTTALSHSSVALLRRVCPKLETLSLNWPTSSGPRGLAEPHFSSHPLSLRSLSIGGAFVLTDFTFLRLCPLLRIIDAPHAFLTDEAVRKIPQCRLLNSLNISYNASVTDEHVTDIVNSCLNLRRLDISSCEKITTRTLTTLHEKATQLEHLDISKNTLLTPLSVRTYLDGAQFLRSIRLANLDATLLAADFKAVYADKVITP